MEIINKDIEMIALFDTDGNIRPYRQLQYLSVKVWLKVKEKFMN